jgi:hypothetical protein
MTAVKNHSMTLKGDDTRIEIESLNPASSTSGWICRLGLRVKGDQSLSVHLTPEEAVKLGTVLFQIVAENSRGQKCSWRFDKSMGQAQEMKQGALRVLWTQCNQDILIFWADKQHRRVHTYTAQF